MNILDIMPGLDPAPAHTADAWLDIVLSRRKTFQGFAEKEEARGIFPEPPFRTLQHPKGQDLARLLFFRVVEELVEAIQSTSREHMLEELIDSFNYLLSAMDIGTIGPDTIQQFTEIARDTWAIPMSNRNGLSPYMLTLANVTLSLARITERFRNRSWMDNVQDAYSPDVFYVKSLTELIRHYLRSFENWEEFWQYFMAKDEVLQFRLRTKY